MALESGKIKEKQELGKVEKETKPRNDGYGMSVPQKRETI
jgi:hypothetical protein